MIKGKINSDKWKRLQGKVFCEQYREILHFYFSFIIYKFDSINLSNFNVKTH